MWFSLNTFKFKVCELWTIDIFVKLNSRILPLSSQALSVFIPTLFMARKGNLRRIFWTWNAVASEEIMGFELCGSGTGSIIFLMCIADSLVFGTSGTWERLSHGLTECWGCQRSSPFPKSNILGYGSWRRNKKCIQASETEHQVTKAMKNMKQESKEVWILIIWKLQFLEREKVRWFDLNLPDRI